MKNGIYYNGEFLEFTYEELADLLAHYRNSGDESSGELTREKCDNSFGTLLPMTSY